MVSPGTPDPPGSLPPADLGTLLSEARVWEQTGYVLEARAAYDRVIAGAMQQRDSGILAEALRRRAVLVHQAGDSVAAEDGLQQSYAVARLAGDQVRAAEALNALGGLRIETGQLDRAQSVLEEAATLAEDTGPLLARVAQNLGVVATIRGDRPSAALYYRRALVAYEDLGDAHGKALAHHNLGMLAADAERWAEAEQHFAACLGVARAAGDAHLEALCRVNRAEVQLAQGETAAARAGVETARWIVDMTGKRSDLADIERVLALCDRAEGKLDQAEGRLQQARTLAAELGAPLTGAEAAHELGRLYHAMNRADEARHYFELAVRGYTELGAESDAARARAELATLEGGQSQRSPVRH
jgi:eukaryotic-like serine/threonine-protein kinase